MCKEREAEEEKSATRVFCCSFGSSYFQKIEILFAKRLQNYTLLLINLKMYFVYSSKEPAFVTLTPPEQYFISVLEQYFLCVNKWQNRMGFFLLTAFRSLL